MVNEIFLHSYKKIRKILRIKEKAEILYAEKNARLNVMGRENDDDENEEYKIDPNEVRRIATSLYARSESGGAPQVEGFAVKKGANNETGNVNIQKINNNNLSGIDEEDEEEAEDDEIHTENSFYEAEAEEVKKQVSKMSNGLKVL